MEDKVRDTKAFYNVTAQSWADKWYADETLMSMHKKFMSLLKPNPRILDLGCGAGYESMRLSKIGAEVVGIDFSEVSIQIAREKNPQIRFEVMDFRELDNSLGEFDAIVAIASIIHLRDEELESMFIKLNEVIKSKGFLWVVFTEGEGFSEKKSFTEINGVKYNRAFYLHKLEYLNSIAKKAGFSFFDEFMPENDSSQSWTYYIYQAT